MWQLTALVIKRRAQCGLGGDLHHHNGILKGWQKFAAALQLIIYSSTIFFSWEKYLSSLFLLHCPKLYQALSSQQELLSTSKGLFYIPVASAILLELSSQCYNASNSDRDVWFFGGKKTNIIRSKILLGSCSKKNYGNTGLERLWNLIGRCFGV